MLRLWKKNQWPISIDFFLLFPMVPLFLFRNAFFRTKTRVEYWKPFFSKYIMRARWPVSAGRSLIYHRYIRRKACSQKVTTKKGVLWFWRRRRAHCRNWRRKKARRKFDDEKRRITGIDGEKRRITKIDGEKRRTTEIGGEKERADISLGKKGALHYTLEKKREHKLKKIRIIFRLKTKKNKNKR